MQNYLQNKKIMQNLYTNSQKILHTFIMGLLCSLVGFGIGFFISTDMNDSWDYFYIYSTLASFMTAAFIWWFLVERYEKYTILRGSMAGLLSGLIAHYICWILFLFTMRISYLLFGEPLSSLGEPPMDLYFIPIGALSFSFFSIFIFGWITLPIGGLIGMILAKTLSILSKKSIEKTLLLSE